MNAKELFLSDGKSAHVYFCGKCRRVAHTLPIADQCCEPLLCECGEKREQYRTICAECSRKAAVAKERERFAAAEKVTECDGLIWKEGCGHRDGFFESVGDLEEWIENEGEDLDFKYVWTCTPIAFAHVDIGAVLDHIYDNSYEEFETDQLSGVKELTAAMAVFNEANKDVVSWRINHKKALIIKSENTH